MATVLVVAVGRRIEGVVHDSDDDKKPGDEGQNLVCNKGPFVELGALRERVVLGQSISSILSC